MQNNTKNMVTIGIHQPEFLPWLGFFKKMQQCDTFVLFDDVQFDRHGFQNRNQIRNKKEPFFLTIPVKSHRISKINEVKMDNSQNWREKHLKTITTNYSKSKFFEEYFKELENIYNEQMDMLVEFNHKTIEFLRQKLEINSEIVLSSSMKIEGKAEDRILKICKKLNADKYISGTSWALKHLDKEEFHMENIEIEYQNFVDPIYRQSYIPFMAKLSTIDLLFNEGEKAKDILKNSKCKIVKDEFLN